MRGAGRIDEYECMVLGGKIENWGVQYDTTFLLCI